jgi:hypothetical protein
VTAAAGPAAAESYVCARWGTRSIMTDTSGSSAELRLSRVNALSKHDLTAVLTYLLARNPDTFPSLLDEALSSVSPGSAADTARTADADSTE